MLLTRHSLIFILCMYVFVPECMFMHHMHAVPTDVRSSETGVTDVYSLLVGAGN